MNIDDMIPKKSNFLTKEDVGEQGRNLTIKAFSQTEVGQEKEVRYVIEWSEQDFKPMVLNKENGSRLKMIFKTGESGQMIGKQVNVYCDPFVSFGGEIKGGIRLRPVATAAAANALPPRRPAPAQKAAVVEEDGPWQPSPPPEAYEKDVPF